MHPGKTTIGQYYAEPTFKLLDVMKQKHWRKLSLRSLTFSWQRTNALVIGCLANSPRLWLCSTEPCRLQSRLGSQWLLPNKKSEVPSSWNLVCRWWITVEAWCESQNRKFYFQGIKTEKKSWKKYTDVAREYVKKWQYVWYSMLIFFIAKLQNFLISPHTSWWSFGSAALVLDDSDLTTAGYRMRPLSLDLRQRLHLELPDSLLAVVCIGWVDATSVCLIMASEVVSKYLFITFENRKTAEIDAVENFGFFIWYLLLWTDGVSVPQIRFHDFWRDMYLYIWCSSSVVTYLIHVWCIQNSSGYLWL